MKTNEQVNLKSRLMKLPADSVFKYGFNSFVHCYVIMSGVITMLWDVLEKPRLCKCVCCKLMCGWLLLV